MARSMALRAMMKYESPAQDKKELKSKEKKEAVVIEKKEHIKPKNTGIKVKK